MVSAPFLVALEICRVSAGGVFKWTFGHARVVYHKSSMGAIQKSARIMRPQACKVSLIPWTVFA